MSSNNSIEKSDVRASDLSEIQVISDEAPRRSEVTAAGETQVIEEEAQVTTEEPARSGDSSSGSWSSSSGSSGTSDVLQSFQGSTTDDSEDGDEVNKILNNEKLFVFSLIF